jgi:hypothetical protein
MAAWKMANPGSQGSVKGSDVSIYAGFARDPF